jgi:hypothetical protein
MRNKTNDLKHRFVSCTAVSLDLSVLLKEKVRKKCSLFHSSGLKYSLKVRKVMFYVVFGKD